jgi:nucleotide-binding universal stress UspA family protein
LLKKGCIPPNIPSSWMCRLGARSQEVQMIKKILVPTTGSQSDEKVFTTALSVARPLGAHLEFYHVRLSDCEAAVRSRHVEFCRGAAMTEALKHLRQREAAFSTGATQHFEAFCEANEIPIIARPAAVGDGAMSAHFEQETDVAEARLISHARHSDLIVLGRPSGPGVLPLNLIEMLLLRAGRPVIIAPDGPARSLEHTVVVGWRETAEAARSLGSAIPLLKGAERVVLVSVGESLEQELPALEEVKCQLAWHGVNAETCIRPGKPKLACDQLLQTVDEFRADLLVVGGFGRGPLRETLFGGVTHSIIGHADCAVFVMH